MLHGKGHAGVIGSDLAMAAAQAQPQPSLGVNQYSEGGCDQITPSDRGTSQAYLLRRLARDAPDVTDGPGPSPHGSRGR